MMIPADANPANDNGAGFRFLPTGCTIVLTVLFAALVVAGLLVAGEAPSAAPNQPRPTIAVTAVTPRRVTWPENVSATGAIAPWEEASIGTQIGSYQLIDVRANVGDQVRRGQVLARLNPALLRAEETQLLARHAQATANDRRARGLEAAGGISAQEALQFATEARTADALLAAKRLELRYTAILAPDDGVITARTATLGAVMPAGQELFRMIRRNRLEWRGEVIASRLGAVAEGQRIRLALPDGSGAQAVVRRTAPALDTRLRTAIVYADLLPGSSARAGMYVPGRIAIGTAPALVVPADCVVIRDGHSHVVELVGVGETPRVALRRVIAGRREGDAIEIARGLAGGERLVLRGGAFLNDGDVVRVVAGRGQRR